MLPPLTQIPEPWRTIYEELVAEMGQEWADRYGETHFEQPRRSWATPFPTGPNVPHRAEPADSGHDMAPPPKFETLSFTDEPKKSGYVTQWTLRQRWPIDKAQPLTYHVPTWRAPWQRLLWAYLFHWTVPALRRVARLDAARGPALGTRQRSHQEG